MGRGRTRLLSRYMRGARACSALLFGRFWGRLCAPARMCVFWRACPRPSCPCTHTHTHTEKSRGFFCSGRSTVHTREACLFVRSPLPPKPTSCFSCMVHLHHQNQPPPPSLPPSSLSAWRRRVRLPPPIYACATLQCVLCAFLQRTRTQQTPPIMHGPPLGKADFRVHRLSRVVVFSLGGARAWLESFRWFLYEGGRCCFCGGVDGALGAPPHSPKLLLPPRPPPRPLSCLARAPAANINTPSHTRRLLTLPWPRPLRSLALPPPSLVVRRPLTTTTCTR